MGSNRFIELHASTDGILAQIAAMLDVARFAGLGADELHSPAAKDLITLF